MILHLEYVYISRLLAVDGLVVSNDVADLIEKRFKQPFSQVKQDTLSIESGGYPISSLEQCLLNWLERHALEFVQTRESSSIYQLKSTSYEEALNEIAHHFIVCFEKNIRQIMMKNHLRWTIRIDIEQLSYLSKLINRMLTEQSSNSATLKRLKDQLKTKGSWDGLDRRRHG